MLTFKLFAKFIITVAKILFKGWKFVNFFKLGCNSNFNGGIILNFDLSIHYIVKFNGY